MSKENLFEYLFNKRSEIKHFRTRDLLLAKAVADIHRHTVLTQMKIVPLWSLSPIHCIDRESAIEKINERANILKEYKCEILGLKKLTKKQLLKYLPSVSGIKVIYEGDGQYISFEGNGRIEAFKKIFNKKDDIRLEVEVFKVDDRNKILRRVNRVRRRNFPAFRG